MKKRHTDENDLLRVKFDMDKPIDIPENADNNNQALSEQTQKQIRYYSEMSALQSKQSTEEQQILQQNKNKEALIDMEIELNNTRTQVVKSDLESYQKTLDNALKGGGMD